MRTASDIASDLGFAVGQNWPVHVKTIAFIEGAHMRVLEDIKERDAKIAELERECVARLNSIATNVTQAERFKFALERIVKSKNGTWREIAFEALGARE